MRLGRVFDTEVPLLRHEQRELILADGSGAKVVQKKGWLAKTEPEKYGVALHQAYEAAELSFRMSDLRHSGTGDVGTLKTEYDAMRQGQAAVAMPPESLHDLAKSASMVKDVQTGVQKDLKEALVKFGKKTTSSKTRKFGMTNGQLIVESQKLFAGSKKRKPYDLSLLEIDDYVLELRPKERDRSLAVPFLGSYEARVVLMHPERKSFMNGQFYLYANKVADAEGWIAQIKMAKYIQDLPRQLMLQRSIQRMVSQKLCMTFEALTAGYHAIKENDTIVRRFVGNLIHPEAARGWKKWRMVLGKQRKQRQAALSSKEWASRLMGDKLVKSRQLTMKTGDELREEVVTAMQRSFKKLRKMQMLGGVYAFPTAVQTRLERAHSGVPVVIFYQALSRLEIFKLCCDANWLDPKDDEGNDANDKVLVPTGRTDKNGLPEKVHRHSFLAEYVKATTEGARPHATLFEGDNCYTDNIVAPGVGECHFSDNLTLLKFFVGGAEGPDYKALNKAQFSYFFRSENISSIILNSDHTNTAAQWFSEPPTGKGRWVTLCGPKVAWGRSWNRKSEFQTRQTRADGQALVGENGPRAVGLDVPQSHALAAKLAKGEADVTTVTLTVVKVGGKDDKGRTLTGLSGLPSQKDRKQITAKVRVSFLGVTKESLAVAEANGEWTYNLTVSASVAHLDGEAAKHYNSAHFVVDIIDDEQDFVISTYEWTLGTLLTHLTGNSPKCVMDVPDVRGSVKLMDVDTQKPHSGSPEMVLDWKVARGEKAETLISPELVGTSSAQTIYTTHKGAYFDGRKGPGRFSVDHVGNCLEIFVKELMLPVANTELEANARYYVKVSCGETFRTTPAYWRPKEGWSKVLPTAEPSTLPVEATLLVPLPADLEARDKVVVELFYDVPPDYPAATFEQAKGGLAGKLKSAPEGKLCGKVIFHTGELGVDDPREMDINFQNGVISEYELFHAELIKGKEQRRAVDAHASIVVALRDRDSARVEERRDLFYVGDSAMLLLEQPALLPKKEHYKHLKLSTEEEDARPMREYRKLFGPELTEAQLAAQYEKKTVPLRDPALQSELKTSGLEGHVHFKQRAIPDFCSHPVPHKYMLSRAEYIHVNRGCAGSYHRVADAAAAKEKDKTDWFMVEELSHTVQAFKVTILALHKDRTCSVEIALDSAAAKDWAENPYKEVLLPGSRVEYREVGEYSHLRLIGVDLSCLQSLQSGGFSVYDAKCPSVAEAARKTQSHKDAREAKAGVGGYSILAGPLPLDANPSVCTHEWTLHVQLPTEDEMYGFAEMVRAAARAAADETKRKLQELAKRPRVEQLIAAKKSGGSVMKGAVEVVVVEATRIREPPPMRMIRAAGHAELYMKNNVRDPIMGYSPYSMDPIVRMVVLGPMGKRLFNPQEIPKLPCEATRVNWGAVDQLKPYGGFTLRTPILDLNKPDHANAVIEFTLCNRYSDGAIPFETEVARASISAAECMRRDKPFQIHWLPLTGLDKAELHIQTRFASTRPETLRADLSSCREYLNVMMSTMAEVRSKYQNPPKSIAYNPNIADQGPAFNAVHSAKGDRPAMWLVQEAFKKQAYGNYIRNAAGDEKRMQGWKDATDKVLAYGRASGATITLDDVRGQPLQDALQACFERGVPEQHRLQAWFEITGAAKVKGTHTFEQYQALVADSDRFNASTRQLEEDFFVMLEQGRSNIPEIQAVHTNNLRAARRICRALIVFSQNSADGQAINVSDFGDGVGRGIAYGKCLLEIAYHLLLLAQDPKQEELVFWILFSLGGHQSNAAYEDYFGLPQPTYWFDGTVCPGQALCSQSQAMSDVTFLDAALAVYDVDLYTTLSKTGFHCSQFFYHCFMTLYAAVLPESALFRLWDRVFYWSGVRGSPQRAACASKQPTGTRSVLVEFAFAALTQKRKEGGYGLREQLESCKTTAEVMDALKTGFLIYESELVADLVDFGAQRLWVVTDPVSQALLNDTFAQTQKIWEDYAKMFQYQAETLKPFIRPNNSPDSGPGRISTTINGKETYSPPGNEITTYLMSKSFCRLIQSYASNKLKPPGGTQNLGGMYRPVQEKVLEIAASQLEGMSGQVSKVVWGKFLSMVGADRLPVKKPKVVDPAPEGMDWMEPQHVTQEQWRMMCKALFRDWYARQPDAHGYGHEMEQVFQYFRKSDKTTAAAAGVNGAEGGDTVSLLEIMVTMVIISSGTVCEKALALFNLYYGSGDGVPAGVQYHPATEDVAEAVEQKIIFLENNLLHEGGDELGKSAIGKEVHALVFRAYTKYSIKERKSLKDRFVFAEAAVKDLRSIQSGAAGKPKKCSLVLWGYADFSQISREKEYFTTDAGKLMALGSLEIDLKYVQDKNPKTSGNGEGTGTLEFNLTDLRISFKPSNTNSSELIELNPTVEVRYFTTKHMDAKRTEVTKWSDKEIQSNRKDMKVISWAETMYYPMMGKKLIPRKQGFGWKVQGAVGRFSYAEKQGHKKSTILTIPAAILHTVQAQPEEEKSAGADAVISMQSVRLLVMTIFQRCLHPMTNRQAVAYADSKFGRARAAPAIMEAIVLQWPLKDEAPTISHILAEPGKYTFKDVLTTVNSEWDTQLNEHAGRIDMWYWKDIKDSPEGTSGNTTLATLLAKREKDTKTNMSKRNKTERYLRSYDVLPGTQRALLIRGRRAGDGEPFEEVLRFDKDGKLDPHPVNDDEPLLKLDLRDDRELHLKWLSKKEFIASMVNSTVLGESLRRMTSADTKSKPAKSIDVEFEVNTGFGNDEFADFVDVGQKVLLEVWDKDNLGTQQFCGEVWLNDLEECRELYEGTFDLKASTTASEMTQMNVGYKLDPKAKNEPEHSGVQRVYTPPERERGPGILSRVPGTKKGKAIGQGHLNFSARWVFPAGKDPGPNPAGDTPAENLPADKRKLLTEWEEKRDRSRHSGKLTLSIKRATNLPQGAQKTCDPFVKVWVYHEEKKVWRLVGETEQKSKTMNPVWNETWDIMMYSGSYEARMDRRGVQGAGALAPTVRMEYGSKTTQKHGVRIFETDTVSDVYIKIQKSLDHMSLMEKKQTGNPVSTYDGIRVSSDRNVLLGFIPPEGLRPKKYIAGKMAEAAATSVGKEDLGKKLERALKAENNWKPLHHSRPMADVKMDLNDFICADGSKDGRKIHLRVIEKSQMYELINPRYFEFAKKQRKDVDSDDASAAGYALYTPIWAVEIFCKALGKALGERHPLTEEAKGQDVETSLLALRSVLDKLAKLLPTMQEDQQTLRESLEVEIKVLEGFQEWRPARIISGSEEEDDVVTDIVTASWCVPSAGPPYRPTLWPGDQSETIWKHGETSRKLYRKDVLYSHQANAGHGIEDDADPDIGHKRAELYKDAEEYQAQGLGIPHIVKSLNEALDREYAQQKEKKQGGLAKPKPFTYESVSGYLTKVKTEKAKKKL
jgi:hypothetical protein